MSGPRAHTPDRSFSSIIIPYNLLNLITLQGLPRASDRMFSMGSRPCAISPLFFMEQASITLTPLSMLSIFSGLKVNTEAEKQKRLQT